MKKKLCLVLVLMLLFSLQAGVFADSSLAAPASCHFPKFITICIDICINISIHIGSFISSFSV